MKGIKAQKGAQILSRLFLHFSFLTLFIPLLLIPLGSARAWADGKTEQKELLVSAAISLKDVLTTLGAKFEEENPKTKVFFNFGASGQLKVQIESGATVDVFISAAAADMDALEQGGHIISSTRKNIASNALVLIKNREKGPFLQRIEDLISKKMTSISIGNPATVPAGRYAKEALVNLKFYDQLNSKLIFAENVRQVLDYVIRGEVDAGFVYKTDVFTEPKVEVVETVSSKLHKPIVYPASVVKSSQQIQLASNFVEFLQEKEKKKVFKQYGFE